MKNTITLTLSTFIFLMAANVAFGQQLPWIYNKGQGSDQLYKKNYVEAAKSFTECLKDNAQADDCYSGRGKAYLALGKTSEAKADFDKAVKLNPKNQEAVEALAKLKSLDVAPTIKMDDINKQRANMTPEMKRQMENVLKSQKDVGNAADETVKAITDPNNQKAVDAFLKSQSSDPLLTMIGLRFSNDSISNKFDEFKADYSKPLTDKRRVEMLNAIISEYQKTLANAETEEKSNKKFSDKDKEVIANYKEYYTKVINILKGMRADKQ